MPPPCGHDGGNGPADCGICRVMRSRPKYALLWGPSCRHLGGATGETRPCPACPRGANQAPVEVRACDLHSQCITQALAIPGLRSCAGCQDFDAGAPAPEARPIGAASPCRLDEVNLHPAAGGLRLNPSLLPWEGGYLLAWRSGWKGSDVWLCRLGSDFLPESEAWRLDLTHPEADVGREDPRLFLHAGRVHVSFIGVSNPGGRVRTSQLYARLGADLRAERVYYPDYPARNAWEKNWQFFSSGGRLYASYSIAPHRVLAIDGDRAELAHSTPFLAHWRGGELRGTAAPVLVGDEWHCWLHDRVMHEGAWRYRAALVTFEDRPPFRISRYSPAPLIEADTAGRPSLKHPAVIWPGGAVRDGADWVLACGVHDRWSELRRVPIALAERDLVRMRPPAWFRLRWNTDDEHIWHDVAGRNEYRLPADMTGWAVLDCGASVGSFAFACRERGTALVHSYEPWAKSLQLLRANADRLGGVRVFAEAIGPAEGRAEYVLAQDKLAHLGATAASTGSGEARPSESGAIPMTSLDLALARLILDGEGQGPFLVKLDIEGGEHAALGAFTRWELVDRWALEYHGGARDLPGLLRAHGYAVEVVPSTSDRGLIFARRKP